MKKLTAIIMGTLFVAAMAFTFNTVALAAPGGHHGGGHHGGRHHGGGHHGGGHHGGGHHGGRHGGYWGFGPGFYVSSSVIADDCYLVKKCYINSFGRRRCTWVQQCD